MVLAKKKDKYFFHEIKATEKVGAKADDLLTVNQKYFREVLEGRVKGELIPRGDHAKDIFLNEKLGKDLLGGTAEMEKKLNVKIVKATFD